MENHCLYCDKQLRYRFSWNTLWQKHDTSLCDECSKQLEPLTGDLCLLCGRSFDEESERYRRGEFCHDCTRWENEAEWQGLLGKNRSLFRYNDFMKELIARFKYRGDTILATIFQAELKRLYKKEFSQKAYLIPIPLSEERIIERGFNQAEQLAQMIGKPFPALLVRQKTDKQSKKSRHERLKTEKPDFYLASRLQEQLKSADIIIIDDIYTTGKTVREAAKVLKQSGARSVSSLTIAR